MMNIRRKLRSVLPPLVVAELRRFSRGASQFSGDYRSWAEAQAAATGYDADLILQRVAAATRQVLAGHAAYERDSVLFAEPAHPYPVLAALLRTAALNQGRLNVIDYGGSLGSTYRQCRAFLGDLPALRWCVVEQPHFAAAGSREFSTSELTFADSLAAVAWWGEPCLVLLSSVLQYLELPGQLLDDLARSQAMAIVIDRTPLSAAAQDRLCVQTVPRSIYSASYPCWILSRQALLERQSRHWSLVSEFSCDEGRFSTRDRFAFDFVGMIFERPA